MKKRKQIELLESELEFARSDYQHTHDTLWQIFHQLCEQFNMHLTIRPKSLLESDDDADDELIQLCLIAEAAKRLVAACDDDDRMSDADFDNAWTDLVRVTKDATC